jgi:hypothetical protein
MGRLWFRAACALIPFLAIFLVFVTVNQTSSKPLASSAAATHPVSETPTSSGGAPGIPASTSSTSDEPPVSTAASAPASAIGSPGTRAGGASGDSADAAAWVTAHSGLFGELRADVTNVDADAANQEISSLPGDCGHLQQDQVAQRTPQVPNAFDEALWGHALGDFAQAISECPSGSAAPNDVSTISEASQNTSSGELALMAMLSEISGKNAS